MTRPTKVTRRRSGNSDGPRGSLGERASDASLTTSVHAPVRRLVMVLGDQLDRASSALAGLDREQDAVLMVEAIGESRHVPSHPQRTVLCLSAMRHFALDLVDDGVAVRYVRLDDPENTGSLAMELHRAARSLTPTEIRMVRPGEHRLVRELAAAVPGTPTLLTEDTHFLTSREQFSRWAAGRKALTMEYFYRDQRKRLGILMEPDGSPVGGAWNYDHDNRESFGRTAPKPPKPRRFEPDGVTRAVMDSVRVALPDHPGELDAFSWPVTREQSLAALDDFVHHRLPTFGRFEDAMWSGEPWLYHAQLSQSLNLKLLRPMECVEAAVRAHRAGAPLSSCEGFIRQIIGWREFIRGVYEHEGPGYAERNGLGQHGALPDFYWTADTDMRCMRECLSQVLRHAYAHHIQRLMVMGNFALISGVHPRAVSDWFLAMYIDAVDWVTLPNTLGMVMHADGTPESPPVVGTKPYAASGQYIKRMSNYCHDCRYDPASRAGQDACPFTVFYWDFLARHRQRFERNPRMATILKNLDRWPAEHLTQITVSARSLRDRFGIGDIDSPRAAPTYEHWTPPNPVAKMDLFTQPPPRRQA